MTLTIDPEFQALCPPLKAEELAQLEASLLAEGCREPLCVWRADENAVILDGHNRSALCLTHNIPFETQDIALESREAAINWIIANQLGRRNLTEEQKSYLRGKRYNLEKKPHGGDHKSNTDNRYPLHKKLAQEYAVAPSTIQADGQFATAVDTLEAQVRQDIRDTVLRRQDREQGKMTKQQVAKAGKLIQSQQVTPQPFMQRKGWRPYQVLEAIEHLGTIPPEEHEAINTFLDQPILAAADGLMMLRNLKEMPQTRRQKMYALYASADPREHDLAMTIVAGAVPNPDPQVLCALRLIDDMGEMRAYQQKNWLKRFPDEPWRGALEEIDRAMATVQERWREIAAQVRTRHKERVAQHGPAITND